MTEKPSQGQEMDLMELEVQSQREQMKDLLRLLLVTTVEEVSQLIGSRNIRLFVRRVRSKLQRERFLMQEQSDWTESLTLTTTLEW